MAWYHFLTPYIRYRDEFKRAAGLFAGLGHLQPLLLATTNSHYLLDRFCVERCCSSEYVSRIVTSIIFMEILATLLVACTGVGIGIGKCSDLGAGAINLVDWTRNNEEPIRGYISSAILILITLGYIQIFYAFTTGGKKGHMHWFYVSLMIQQFVCLLIGGAIGFWEGGVTLWYLMAIPMGPIPIFFYQLMIHSWIRNNGPRDAEYIVVEWQIWLALSISILATFYWTIGYVITYGTATITNLDGTNPSIENGTKDSIKVQYAGSNKSITLQSTPDVTVTVTATLTGPRDSNKYDVTITATIESAYSGTITVYNKTVTVSPTEKSNKITLDTSGETINVQQSDRAGKTTANLKAVKSNNSVEIKFESVNPTPPLPRSSTYTYKTFYPNHGYYINIVQAGSANLWKYEWDGGQCEYAEYYERTNGSTNTLALLMLYVRLLGSLDTRYFGKLNTTTSAGTWKIIDADTFYKNLDIVKGSAGKPSLGNVQPDERNNLVKGTANEDYNTSFSMVLWSNWDWKKPTATWAPLVMHGIAVGSFGSIFPNLIPKTLVCARTSRTLSVVSIFLSPLPHIFNVMFAENGWPSAACAWTENPGWQVSWLLYLFYGMAFLFAIFNVHSPEWKLCCYIRSHGWMPFMMTLSITLIIEILIAIARAGIMMQRPANGKDKNHPLLWNKMFCLMSLSYLPFWLTTTPMMKSYVSSLDPFLCDKDRDHWPTARYGRMKSFGYWCKCGLRGLYNSPRKLVTRDMRKALTRKDPKMYFLVTHDLGVLLMTIVEGVKYLVAPVVTLH